MDILTQVQNLEIFRGGIAVPIGEELLVVEGDTVRVHTIVGYRGPRIENAEVYTAIGWQTGIIIPEFIEAYVGRTGTVLTFEENAKAEFDIYDIACDVPIPAIMMPIEFALYGNVLDLYAKIINVPGPDIFTPIYLGVIKVLRKPEFSGFAITSYERIEAGG